MSIVKCVVTGTTQCEADGRAHHVVKILKREGGRDDVVLISKSCTSVNIDEEPTLARTAELALDELKTLAFEATQALKKMGLVKP